MARTEAETKSEVGNRYKYPVVLMFGEGVGELAGVDIEGILNEIGVGATKHSSSIIPGFPDQPFLYQHSYTFKGPSSSTTFIIGVYPYVVEKDGKFYRLVRKTVHEETNGGYKEITTKEYEEISIATEGKYAIFIYKEGNQLKMKVGEGIYTLGTAEKSTLVGALPVAIKAAFYKIHKEYLNRTLGKDEAKKLSDELLSSLGNADDIHSFLSKKYYYKV